MKKLYTTTVFSLLFAIVANAQCTIDSNSNNFGFAPVPQAIPCIERGTPLNNNYVLKVYFPISEHLPPITYHYLTITGFNGLPQGITYTKYPPQDTIWPGGRQCFLFQGTTTDSMGTYTLQTMGNVKATVIGVDTTFSIATATQILHALPIANYSGFAYYLTVCAAAGIEPIENTNIKIYPNPASTNLSIDNPTNINLTAVLTNLLGEHVRTITINNAHYQFDISTLPAGMYQLHISNGQQSLNVFKVVKAD